MVDSAEVSDEAKANTWGGEKADLEGVVSVNLMGVSLGIKHAAQVMIQSRRGSIINGRRSARAWARLHPMRTPSLSKLSWAHKLCDCRARTTWDLCKLSVTLFNSNTIVKRLLQNQREWRILSVLEPLDEIALQKEDVAEAAIYLGSDESEYISGHYLAGYGGFTTINPTFGLFARA